MKVLLKKPALFFLALSIFASSTSVLGMIPSLIMLAFTVFFIMFEYGFKTLERKSVYWFFAFCLIVVLYAAFGLGVLNAATFRARVYSFITLLPLFIISYYINKKISIEEIAALLFVFLLALTYSVVGTTLVGFIDPMALRRYGFGERTGFDSLELIEASRYYSMGMLSYPKAHALAVVSVGLSALICFTEKKWVRIIAIILLVLIIRLLFVMTITTAMLISVIGVAYVFSYRFSRGKVYIATLLVLLFGILFFVLGLSSALLDFTQDTNTVLSAKLFDLFYSVETGSGEGQAGYRMELYMTSFKTFLRNPIFGGGVDNGSRTVIGEHSFVLDYLAYFGLFALFFFGSIWKEFKTNGMILNNKLKKCYYVSFLSVVVLWLSKSKSVCVDLPFMSLIFLQVVFLSLESNQTNMEQNK